MLDEPIDPTGLCLPENMWFELALGVAAHRYFLHVDDPLTADVSLPFAERRRLFAPAEGSDQAERKARLVHRILDDFGAGDAATVIDIGTDLVLALDPAGLDDAATTRLRTAICRARALNLPAIPDLGVAGVVTGPDSRPVAPWMRVLGVVTVGIGASAEEASRALLGQSAANLHLAFLYAAFREGYAGEDAGGTLEEVAAHLVERYGEANAFVHDLGERLIDGHPKDGFVRTPGEPPTDLLAGGGYLPAADLVHTLARSRVFREKYLRGLGVGQS
jgi:hypothetical protein